MSTMAVTRFETVPSSKIVFPPQTRKCARKAALDGLRSNIEAFGLLQAPIGYWDSDKFAIVVGECRTRMVIAAGAGEVTVRTLERAPSAQERLELQLSENLNRSDLLAIEVAEALDAWMKQSGCGVVEAAKRFGFKSPGQVTKHLRLLTYEDEIKALLWDDKLGLTSAYALHRITDSEERVRKAKLMAAGELTRDAVADSDKRRTTKHAIRATRIVAALPGGRSVTVTGGTDDLGSMIATLEELLNRARKARREELTTAAFAKLLKRESKRGATRRCKNESRDSARAFARQPVGTLAAVAAAPLDEAATVAR